MNINEQTLSRGTYRYVRSTSCGKFLRIHECDWNFMKQGHSTSPWYSWGWEEDAKIKVVIIIILVLTHVLRLIIFKCCLGLGLHVTLHIMMMMMIMNSLNFTLPILPRKANIYDYTHFVMIWQLQPIARICKLVGASLRISCAKLPCGLHSL